MPEPGKTREYESRLLRRSFRKPDGKAGKKTSRTCRCWAEGTHCELAARGCCRDGKKGREQIGYELLTGYEGRPVVIRVFPGSAR